MFTPKKIENALVRLFDLFDAEVMEGLYENYGEEIEDISPRWLAKAFREKACTVYEYRAVCRVGDVHNDHQHGKRQKHRTEIGDTVCPKRHLQTGRHRQNGVSDIHHKNR